MDRTFIAFLLCVTFGAVSAQVYLASPVPATCGQTNYTGVPANCTVGASFSVTWSQNGQNSNEPVYLTLYDMNNVPVASLGANGTFNSVTTTIRVPPGTLSGDYWLEWRWTNVINCAYIHADPDPLGSVPLYLGVPVTKMLTTQYDYYEYTVNNRYFLWFDVNGPDGVSHPNAFVYVMVKKGLQPPPTMLTYNERLSTETVGSMSFGACNDQGGNSPFRAAVLGATGADNTTSYSIGVSIYDGLVNVGSAPQRSSGHAGNRYYRTQAYATFDTPRRVVLQGDDLFPEEIQFKLSTTCDFAGVVPAKQTGGSTYCIQLGDKAGNKYISVSPVSIGYTVTTEDGKCEDTGAGVALMVPLFSLALLLAFLLFM